MTSSRQMTVIEGTCAILELTNSLADVNSPGPLSCCCNQGATCWEVPEDGRTLQAKLAYGGRLLAFLTLCAQEINSYYVKPLRF